MNTGIHSGLWVMSIGFLAALCPIRTASGLDAGDTNPVPAAVFPVTPPLPSAALTNDDAAAPDQPTDAEAAVRYACPHCGSIITEWKTYRFPRYTVREGRCSVCGGIGRDVAGPDDQSVVTNAPTVPGRQMTSEEAGMQVTAWKCEFCGSAAYHRTVQRDPDTGVTDFVYWCDGCHRAVKPFPAIPR